MVARAARFRIDRGETSPLDAGARTDLPFPGVVGDGVTHELAE